jgi:succinate dehydrogenase/fumarate reductase flavoprotein subunit
LSLRLFFSAQAVFIIYYPSLITYDQHLGTETFYRKRDIIIIGAGFSGLWAAISIKEKSPEKSVLIIERNAVPLGASTRNAGFACFGSLTEVIADSQKMGWEKTLDLVRMRFEGLGRSDIILKMMK